MKVLCKKYYQYYEDVRTLKTLMPGKEYDLDEKFCKSLLDKKIVEVVKYRANTGKKQDKRTREDKAIK